MTEQECVEWMEYLGNMKLAYDRSPNKRRIACDVSIKALEEIQQYRALGTVEELRVARDKQNAKQVSFFGDGYADGNLVYDEYECPCCGARYELEYEEHKYCPECGQAMKIEFF